MTNVPQPKKVLHVLNSAGGGACLSTLGLIESLRTKGVKSCIVCHDAGSPAERRALRDATDDQVFFTWLYWWNKKLRSPWWKRPLVEMRQLWRTGWHRTSTAKIAEFARRQAVDLVHSNTILTLEGPLAARQLRLPHVWHVRELVGPGKPFRFHNEGPEFGRFLQHYSAKVIANSEVTAGLFRDWLPPGLLEVVPNGIDVYRFQIREEPPTKDKIVVAMVGNLTARWKKHILLIEAAARVDWAVPIEWRFYGADPSRGGAVPGDEYLDRLHHRIAEIGLTDRFRFSGFVEDPVRIMSEIDILVHPADHESFGRVVAEAMAAGLPVVGVRGGGVGEIVADGVTGLLAEPDDVECLARHIDRLARDGEMRKKLGLAGRRRVEERFSLESYAEGVLNVYRAALTRPVGIVPAQLS
jgi:glycosyltransferase involved in cell wall biosynthesis